MRVWVAVLTAMIAACRPAGRLEPHTRSSRLHITFVAERDSFRLAARTYDSLWTRDGERMTDALERAARLTFADIGDTNVVAIVFEGVSNSGYRDKPMHVRASYPTATKKATLMHELGHRLESELFHASENDHPTCFSGSIRHGCLRTEKISLASKSAWRRVGAACIPRRGTAPWRSLRAGARHVGIPCGRAELIVSELVAHGRKTRLRSRDR